MSLNTPVSLNEAADLIQHTGSAVSTLLMGEPGIGKSAILGMLAERFPNYHPVYVDATLLDLGDIQMPLVDSASVRFVPNQMFVSDKPLLLMLDEIGKAMRPVQNALLPLMNGEKRIGNYKLHPDSIVFATTNLASDGVGDSVQAHARNRMCVVAVQKPDAEAWMPWAINHGVDPALLAWVREYPHCLASYTDDSQTDNPYIYHPKRMQAAFVTPRSLEKASRVLEQRMYLSPTTLIGALAGTVGESAARDMQAFLTVADTLPEWARVIAHPTEAPVPTSPIAQQILALGATVRLDAASVTGWLTYMARLMPEVQALFATSAMKSSKASLLVSNKLFTSYAIKNSWVY